MTEIKESINKIKSKSDLITILNYYGIHLNKSNMAKCPFHNEKTASLSIKEEGNKAIYHCFGCNAHGDIIDFIREKEGLEPLQAVKKAYEILNIPLQIQPSKLDNFINFISKKDNYNNCYTYKDENNNPLYMKVKYVKDGKKSFITKGIDETKSSYKYIKDFNTVPKVVYNLSGVKKAIENNNNVYFVEGEKDADNLIKLGFTATTVYSKKWFESYTKQLTGSKIVFIGDTGEAGEQFKQFIWDNVKNIVKAFKVVNLPGLEQLGNNKDVTDWLEAGHTKEELIEAINRSLDLLNEKELQQDKLGIYHIWEKTDKETKKVIKQKSYYTNFQIEYAEILENADTNDQEIILHIISELGRKDEIKANARELFSDTKTFKKALGVHYIYKQKAEQLVKLHEWILKYHIRNVTTNYTITGIRELNNENVLITNKGTLFKDGSWDSTIKADNSYHDIDFTGIDTLTKDEAKKLLKYLLNFNTPENVLNSLGLGVAQMLNKFARESVKDNLPILQIVGESSSGKSKTFNILRLLYNNTKIGLSYSGTTDFTMQKALSNTYLPIFVDEVKPSKSSIHRLNMISNNIRSVTEGYINYKGTKNQTLNEYETNGTLILSGEELISETAIKNRSNIVWHSRSNFTDKTAESIKFLCDTRDGNMLLKRFSKSLYLHVLNNYSSEALEIKYDELLQDETITSLIESPRERNTLIYTLIGIEIINGTLEDLGLNNISLNIMNCAVLIAENLLENVLDGNLEGTLAEYEVILKEIDHLVEIKDITVRLTDTDYKEVEEGIAIRAQQIWDKLERYYKTYKSEKLPLDKNTFTKTLRKSKYYIDYKKVKFKTVEVTTDGEEHLTSKPYMAFILDKKLLKELGIENLIVNISTPNLKLLK